VNANQHRIADFVRGFFYYLESHQVRAAVLHGGDDGFERELSDVDFVVTKVAFDKLPTLIDVYCNQSAWRLCQILRHETTAAYFVCSAADEPACAVALDACSDYQRNGTVFLTAEILLENREPLKWGGYCLSPAYELRYRFAKAAAKKKDTVNTAIEFATYPKKIQHDCAAWLYENWNIAIDSWAPVDLASALNKLRAKSNQRPSLLQKGGLGRIFSRILRPTGLILVVGDHDFEATAASFESVFGHLYFRRFRKAEKYSALFLKDLVASTLIVVPQLGFPVNKLLPANCIYHLNSAHDPDTQCREIALYLYERCKKSGFYKTSI
jgi:hypothetical protein